MSDVAVEEESSRGSAAETEREGKEDEEVFTPRIAERRPVEEDEEEEDEEERGEEADCLDAGR